MFNRLIHLLRRAAIRIFHNKSAPAKPKTPGTILLYKSLSDGTIKGLDRADFKKLVTGEEDWNKAMKRISSMDVPVWMFGSRGAANQFAEVQWIS